MSASQEQTLEFLQTETGKQLMDTIKTLGEGIRNIEHFFKAVVPGYIPSDHTTDGKKRKLKRVSDPNAPKQPPSSYLLFCGDFRAETKEALPDEKNMAGVLGQMWREAEQSVKDAYSAKADALRLKYHQDLEAYKKAKDIVLPVGSDSSEEESESEAIASPVTKKAKIAHVAVQKVALVSEEESDEEEDIIFNSAAPSPVKKVEVLKKVVASAQKTPKQKAKAAVPVPAKVAPIIPAFTAEKKKKAKKTHVDPIASAQPSASKKNKSK